MKGLNFLAIHLQSNLDIVSAMVSVVSKHLQTLDMEFRWKIRFVLEKSKSSSPNISKKELKAVRCSGLNEEVSSIIQADVVNCTMVL